MARTRRRPYQSFGASYYVRSLLDDAEVGSERLDLSRTQLPGHDWHRCALTRMVALAPLLKPCLQIGIGQTSETRDIPYTLAIRTVTGIAGRDVGLGNSGHIDGPAARGEIPVSVIGRPGRNRRKIVGEIARGLRSECRHRTPHILP